MVFSTFAWNYMQQICKQYIYATNMYCVHIARSTYIPLLLQTPRLIRIEILKSVIFMVFSAFAWNYMQQICTQYIYATNMYCVHIARSTYIPLLLRTPRLIRIEILKIIIFMVFFGIWVELYVTNMHAVHICNKNARSTYIPLLLRTPRLIGIEVFKSVFYLFFSRLRGIICNKYARNRGILWSFRRSEIWSEATMEVTRHGDLYTGIWTWLCGAFSQRRVGTRTSEPLFRLFCPRYASACV